MLKFLGVFFKNLDLSTPENRVKIGSHVDFFTLETTDIRVARRLSLVNPQALTIFPGFSC